MSWGELRELTARVAAGLRRFGVAPGDRVAAYMPNIPEATAALLDVCVDRCDLVQLLPRLRGPKRC
jgi:acyl-coenzyme A synthetase/AMP-(fatty) acid ligase